MTGSPHPGHAPIGLWGRGRVLDHDSGSNPELTIFFSYYRKLSQLERLSSYSNYLHLSLNYYFVSCCFLNESFRWGALCGKPSWQQLADLPGRHLTLPLTLRPTATTNTRLHSPTRDGSFRKLNQRFISSVHKARFTLLLDVSIFHQ